MGSKITANALIQIAGRPIEKVEEALKIVVEKIKEDKRIKVNSEEISEPEFEEESKLYSGLIELNAKFENTQTILDFIVDFTPNSIEIEEPNELKFDSAEFTGILNDMSAHMLRANIKNQKLNSQLYSAVKQLQELKPKK